jgi:hypothetical protein
MKMMKITFVVLCLNTFKDYYKIGASTLSFKVLALLSLN